MGWGLAQDGRQEAIFMQVTEGGGLLGEWPRGQK